MGSVDEQSYSVKSQSGYNRVRSASKEIARMDEDPRVLVIDDDEALRELVIRVVKQAGYQVDAVGDGQAGLERLAERAYDVILSDVRMPGMDGIAFYQEVSRRHPAQADRIILVTAHVQLEHYQEFMQTVRAPILQKPFTLGEFHGALARMLGPRAPRQPRGD
jgi:CheY-like chemotaxis protein